MTHLCFQLAKVGLPTKASSTQTSRSDVSRRRPPPPSKPPTRARQAGRLCGKSVHYDADQKWVRQPFGEPGRRNQTPFTPSASLGLNGTPLGSHFALCSWRCLGGTLMAQRTTRITL